MIKKDFKFDNFDRNEVWRYLGRKDQIISKDLDRLLDDVLKETISIAKPMAIYEYGPISIDEDSIKLLNCNLTGDGIKDLLGDSEEGYIFAATLGFLVDQRIKQYEITDLTRALIMDACASVLIEMVCDQVNEEIDELSEKKNQFTTERFSPGYSDLPLNTQSDILKTLDTNRRIGLTCSETYLLFPRKSVTAIIGNLKQPREPRGYICKDCILNKNCKFGICKRKI